MAENSIVDTYIKRITKQTKKLCTYQPEFDITIRNFAELLAERERVYQKYLSEGAAAVIVHRSDRGSENTVKNPLLLTWLDLTAEARKFAGELGLTPKALRTLSDIKIQPPTKENPFEEVLNRIENNL